MVCNNGNSDLTSDSDASDSESRWPEQILAMISSYTVSGSDITGLTKLKAVSQAMRNAIEKYPGMFHTGRILEILAQPGHHDELLNGIWFAESKPITKTATGLELPVPFMKSWDNGVEPFQTYEDGVTTWLWPHYFGTGTCRYHQYTNDSGEVIQMESEGILNGPSVFELKFARPDASWKDTDNLIIGKIPPNFGDDRTYDAKCYVGTWYNLRSIPPLNYTDEEQVLIDKEQNHYDDASSDAEADMYDLKPMSREDLLRFIMGPRPVWERGWDDGVGYAQTHDIRLAALRRYLDDYKEIHIRILWKGHEGQEL